MLLLVNELANKELKVLILGSAAVGSESDGSIKTAFLRRGVISKGIIIDNAEVVLPREALGLGIEVGAERVRQVLLAELVDSRHLLFIKL